MLFCPSQIRPKTKMATDKGQTQGFIIAFYKQMADIPLSIFYLQSMIMPHYSKKSY